jgi:hypothetical protein
MRTHVKNNRLFYLRFHDRLGHGPGSTRHAVNILKQRITFPLKEQSQDDGKPSKKSGTMAVL